MKMMKLEKMKIGIITFCVLSLLISTGISGVSAESDIDSVILSTTENYPDALVAAAAANKIGAPVLLTEKNEVSNEAMNQIKNFNAETIYIIGGPAVISPEVEEELEGEGYEVIRLWGMTRYGTSAEAARYFWSDEESEDEAEVVIVWDKIGTPENGNEEMVVMAKDLAQSNNGPLLIASQDTLPAVQSDVLEDLGIENVTLIGEFGNGVKSELGNRQVREFAGNQDQIREGIKERILNRTGNNKSKLVVVGVGNWKDTIGAPFHPGNSVTRLIKNDSQIPELIAEIEAGGYDEIKVVGKPELVDNICDSLSAQNIEADCLSGNAEKIAARMAEKNAQAIERIRSRYQQRISQMVQQMQRKANQTEEECSEFFNLSNSTLQRLEGNITDPQEYHETVRELNQQRRECMRAVQNGNFVQAKQLAQKIKSRAETMRWKLRNLTGEEIQQQINSETQNKEQFGQMVKEQVQKIKKKVNEIVKEIKNQNTEQCQEQLSNIEQLQNEGKYSKIQNKLSQVKMHCEKAQEKAQSDKSKPSGTPSGESPGKSGETPAANKSNR